MVCEENLFYFCPCILKLSREKPDYYNKSRYRTSKEIAAAKKESECTREFVKEIIFKRIRQMRINAIRSMIEKHTFVTSKDSVKVSELPLPSSKVEKNLKAENFQTVSEGKRSTEYSNSSRKSVSSGGYVTTTTTTRTVTRVIQESYEEPHIQESYHQVYQNDQNKNSSSISRNEFSSITDPTEFQRKFLDDTNKYRSKHDSPPLILSKELCDFAQDWANHLANTGNLKHRSNCQYGENLYASSGLQVDGGTAVKAWYDEIGEYNFDKPQFSQNTGHFTQLVWKSSKQVGVGMTVKNGWIYVAANYSPPGNVLGQFQQNVLKKKK